MEKTKRATPGGAADGFEKLNEPTLTPPDAEASSNEPSFADDLAREWCDGMLAIIGELRQIRCERERRWRRH
jgi:hypothetical protein